MHGYHRPVNSVPAQTAPAVLGLRWLDHVRLVALIRLYNRHGMYEIPANVLLLAC